MSGFNFGSSSGGGGGWGGGSGFGSSGGGFGSSGSSWGRSGGGFGSSGSGFGSSGSGFGSSSFGSSSFGNSSGNKGGSSSGWGQNRGGFGGGFGNNQQSPFVYPNTSGQSSPNDNPMEDLNRIYQSYNPQSPDCRFEAILYNKVPREFVSSFKKPPYVRIQVWDEGTKQNPDPENLVPVAVRGYDALKERAEICLRGQTTCESTFEDLSKTVTELRSKCDLEFKPALIELKRKHVELSLSLLRLFRKFITVNTTTHRATTQEVKLGKYLKQLQNDCTLLNNYLDQIKQTFESVQRRGKGDVSMLGMDSVAPSDEQMYNMFQFLNHQKDIIHHLIATLQDDSEDLAIISKDLNGRNLHDVHMSSPSTSRLR